MFSACRDQTMKVNAYLPVMFNILSYDVILSKRRSFPFARWKEKVLCGHRMKYSHFVLYLFRYSNSNDHILKNYATIIYWWVSRLQVKFFKRNYSFDVTFILIFIYRLCFFSLPLFHLLILAPFLLVIYKDNYFFSSICTSFTAWRWCCCYSHSTECDSDQNKGKNYIATYIFFWQSKEKHSNHLKTKQI